MKLRKILILLHMLFVMFTMFVTIFVPMMAGVFYFIIFIALSGQIIVSFILLAIMMFGALFISLAIVGKIAHYYDEVYEWQKRYDEIEEKDEKP